MTIKSKPAPLLLPALKAFLEQRKIPSDSPDYPNLVRLVDLNPRHGCIAHKFVEAIFTIHIQRPNDDAVDASSDLIRLKARIAQFRLNDYRFPWGCIAYCPPESDRVRVYHQGCFYPSDIDVLFLEDDEKPFKYRLVPRNTRDEQYNVERSGPNDLFSTFVFYAEDVDAYKRHPVKVLFKQNESQMFHLHTVLFPLALMELIVSEPEKGRKD